MAAKIDRMVKKYKMKIEQWKIFHKDFCRRFFKRRRILAERAYPPETRPFC
jgi:hypothetical protein